MNPFSVYHGHAGLIFVEAYVQLAMTAPNSALSAPLDFPLRLLGAWGGRIRRPLAYSPPCTFFRGNLDLLGMSPFVPGPLRRCLFFFPFFSERPLNPLIIVHKFKHCLRWAGIAFYIKASSLATCS